MSSGRPKFPRLSNRKSKIANRNSIYGVRARVAWSRFVAVNRASSRLIAAHRGSDMCNSSPRTPQDTINPRKDAFRAGPQLRSFNPASQIANQKSKIENDFAPSLRLAFSLCSLLLPHVKISSLIGSLPELVPRYLFAHVRKAVLNSCKLVAIRVTQTSLKSQIKNRKSKMTSQSLLSSLCLLAYLDRSDNSPGPI
jgi:hypothetical protein